MKKILVMLIMFLAFSTVKAQDFISGQVYVIYEKEVSLCEESQNNYSFFFVLSAGDDFTVSEAIFNEERSQLFVGLDFVHNRDPQQFLKYMTHPLLPVVVEDGELLMPLYKAKK